MRRRRSGGTENRKKTAKSRPVRNSTRAAFQLRQQESNLRWGSQSPLPYRLAMAHHAKQYSIFSAVPQEVRRIFAAFFRALSAALAAVWVGFWALRPGSCVFHILPCFYERQVLRDAFFKKHSPQGAQDSYCKGEIYFFPDFSYYFLKRLYFLLRFWYTGCDKNKLKKLRRCPGYARTGQCLHLCEGKRGIS